MTSVWRIEFTETAKKQLAKLDRQIAKRIHTYLRERVAEHDPLRAAKRLQGPLSNYWSYRVGDHRVLCEVINTRLVVLVLKVEHRSDVYR